MLFSLQGDETIGHDLTKYATGRYLNAKSLRRALRAFNVQAEEGMDVTIRSVAIERVYTPHSNDHTPTPIVYFEGWEKGVVGSVRVLNELEDALGGPEYLENTDLMVGKRVRIRVEPHNPNDFIAFARARSQPEQNVDAPIGAKTAEKLRARMEELDLKVGDFMAWLREEDFGLFEKCNRSELEDWPKRALDVISRWVARDGAK